MRSPSKAWFRLLPHLSSRLPWSVPALTACAAQDEGKVLRIHHPVYPDVVDPQKSSFTNEIDILALAYEGLTRLDTNQETVPAAAESGSTTRTPPRSPSTCGRVSSTATAPR